VAIDAIHLTLSVDVSNVNGFIGPKYPGNARNVSHNTSNLGGGHQMYVSNVWRPSMDCRNATLTCPTPTPGGAVTVKRFAIVCRSWVVDPERRPT
jgi:hypothetical protein